MSVNIPYHCREPAATSAPPGTQALSEAMTQMTVTAASTRAVGQAISVPVHGWQVQSSAVAGRAGESISRPGYRSEGWLAAPARSTVMAALLADGQYPDVFRSTRMRDRVDPGRFLVPWWYRSLFEVSAGGRTALRLEGVMHSAELWVNGVQVAGPDRIAGAYAVHTIDVTDVVVPGSNAVAIKVFPGHPMMDLSVGWIDWNPAPPDNNMGIWRDMWIRRTGEIRLADPYVVSDLTPALDRADLRVGMDLHGAADTQRTVTVRGTIVRLGGQDATASGGQRFRRCFEASVTVPAGGCEHVVLTAERIPELSIHEPDVWWPIGQGPQPLYQLHLAVSDGDELSDQADVTFGVRRVTSHLEDGGGRRFVVNGRPMLILGGGWCSDIFLRHDRQRLTDQLDYVVDLGLNAIRLEGKLENPEFFDLADRRGIMVLPGWECCTKWESHACTGGAPWTDADYRIAAASMAGEARLLRNHPSVISFQIGSDFAPSPQLAETYMAQLRAADWSVPIVSSGASRWNNEPSDEVPDVGSDLDTTVTAGVWPDTTVTEAAGPSGMKMWPYDWVPPRYWYADRFGGAIGFDSECSAGHSVPRLPSLKAMLEPTEIDRLWQQPDAHHYHAAPGAPFDSLGIFAEALAARYGSIGSLHDFLRKAQLANYEMVRAQFEAYRARSTAARPATGVIYWMLNNAWPSLNWHLFDYYLDPAAAYFGAKKANEPVHVQLSYDTREVLVVNGSAEVSDPLTVHAHLRGLDGAEIACWTRTLDPIGGSGVVPVGRVPAQSGVSDTHFVELELDDAEGSRVSRNVYWMSTREDELDWDRTTWQYTPQSEYADLTGLQRLAVVRPDVTADIAAGVTDDHAGEPLATATVTVRNRSAVPAVGIHLSVVGDGGRPVAPILWQDNDITLFPGQAAVVTGRFPATESPGDATIRVEGFNVAEQDIRPRTDPAATTPER